MSIRKRPAQIDPPGPGQESVWDYPRPPRVEPVTRRIRVELGGIVLAESVRAYRIIETASPPVYHLPPADVRTEYLEPSPRSTFCEWKGRAKYWSVRVGDRFAEDAASGGVHGGDLGHGLAGLGAVAPDRTECSTAGFPGSGFVPYFGLGAGCQPLSRRIQECASVDTKHPFRCPVVDCSLSGAGTS